MRNVLLVIVCLILSFCFMSCETEEPVYPRTKVLLPQVSKEYKECIIRYKNSYYDNRDLIHMRMRIVNVYGGGIKSYLSEKPLYKAPVEANLNKSFVEAGIQFHVVTEENEYTGESISDFALNASKYEKYGVITLLIYHTEHRVFNGIAIGAPGNVIAVHASKVGAETLVHEMGHALGLLHTFEADSSDGYNSRTGDAICDTPSYDVMRLRVNFECKHVGEPMFSEEELSVIIPNYQSYTGKCRDSFTPVQILAMRWYITNAPILTSTVY